MASLAKTNFLQYHKSQNFQFPENAVVELSWFRETMLTEVVWVFQPRVFQCVNHLLFLAVPAGLTAVEVKALQYTNLARVCSVHVAKI